MHKVFRKLLEDATGVSEFIIAVNLDIRGFSLFSKKVESPDTAMFIKKVYMRLIDNYFPNASFFKPTGDGLLIILPYTEKDLQDVAENTINSCLKVLKEFGTFCVNDPMINFEVPRKVGIGLSRGTACRLVSESKILDYSGRVLNLASRLMDFARPSGIVFDAEFGIELLSDKQIELFEKDSIYIKGIAERDPVDIYYTKDLTRIPPLSKQPIDRIKWNSYKQTLTLRKIKDYPPRFRYPLTSEPVDPSEIKVRMTYPGVVRGRKRKGFISIFDFSNFEYSLEAGEPIVTVEFDALAKRLEAEGVKDSWGIEIEIMYPEK
ncbi:MAG: adenylate/guanylate cyclase domain-containing protein [bacterium]